MGQMRPWKAECVLDILYRASQSLSPDVDIDELEEAFNNAHLDRQSPPAAPPSRRGSIPKPPLRALPISLPKFTNTPPIRPGTSSEVADPTKNSQNLSETSSRAGYGPSETSSNDIAPLHDLDPDPQAGQKRWMDPSHDVRPVRPSNVPWAGLDGAESEDDANVPWAGLDDAESEDDDDNPQKRLRLSPEKHSQTPVTFIDQAPKQSGY